MAGQSGKHCGVFVVWVGRMLNRSQRKQEAGQRACPNSSAHAFDRGNVAASLALSYSFQKALLVFLTAQLLGEQQVKLPPARGFGSGLLDHDPGYGSEVRC